MNNKSTNNINLFELKKKLGNVVDTGKNFGLPESAIVSATRKIGDFLSITIEPDSDTEKMIFKLWKNATTEEKKILTKLLLKALYI